MADSETPTPLSPNPVQGSKSKKTPTFGPKYALEYIIRLVTIFKPLSLIHRSAQVSGDLQKLNNLSSMGSGDSLSVTTPLCAVILIMFMLI